MKRTIEQQDEHLKNIKVKVDLQFLAVVVASAIMGIGLFILTLILFLL